MLLAGETVPSASSDCATNPAAKREPAGWQRPTATS
jgi:hypothetical protein